MTKLHTRRAATLAILGMIAAMFVAGSVGSAGAVSGAPGTPATLPASNASMWQTDGPVWSLAYSNGVVYAGGAFTHICAPGTSASACTSSGTPMSRIAAFNASDGTPCAIATPCPGGFVWSDPGVNDPNTNDVVYALSITPNGSKLYAGGDFSTVKGTPRSHVAAFNLSLPTQPLLSFNPGLNKQVRALATTDSNLYIGGLFTNSGHARVAAYDITGSGGGVLRSDWAPTVDGNVFTLMIGPGSDSGNVVLGGNFRNVNGESHSGIAQLSQASPATNGPMSNTIVPGVVGATHSDVKTLTTDGTSIFLGAEGTGYGIFDGTASINPSTGNPNWKSNCLGATQAIAVLGSALYIGSHSHNCSLPNLTGPPTGGGFGQLPFNGDERSWHHLIAEQTNGNTAAGGGQLLNWFPTVNNGPVFLDQTHLGPRAMATDGTTLWVGGEFTTVGGDFASAKGTPQQGLTRFVATDPDSTPPVPTFYGPPPTSKTGTLPTNPPTATSPAPGQVTLRYPGFTDADDRTLSYTIARDGTQVSSTTGNDSPFWQSADHVFRDTGVPAGSHTYTVTVTDAGGQSATATASVTVASAATGGYATVVKADNPSSYWRLDDTSGTVAADSSPLHNKPGTYRGSITRRSDGAIGSDPAIAVANGVGVSNVQGSGAPAPTNYSLEAWIRTAAGATKGGRILGFSPTFASTTATANRAIYMMNNGQLIYSILTSDGSTCHFGEPYGTPGTCYVMSKQSYNDGTWHHVVATQSSTGGIALYVDGVKVNTETETPATKPKTGNGVWEAGFISSFTSTPWGPTNPSSFTGDVDEFAVYPTALNATQISAHWKAGE
jgi:hypothetical protein